MKEILSQLKNQRSVKTFAWNIIVVASLAIIYGLIGITLYLLFMGNHIDFQTVPLNSLSSFLNPRLYFLQSIIQIIISLLLILCSKNVLRYYEKWRKALIIVMIITILFLIIIPIINIHNIPNIDTALESWGNAKIRIVTWSITTSLCLGGFFCIAIIRLSEENVKRLFR